ncbi:hypothetical protein Tco_1399237 [Tanacetum coccineum]
MSPRSHKRFVSDTAIATRLRGYYILGTRGWVRRGSCRILIPINMYPYRVEERLTIESVSGEEIIKIETSVIVKDGTITKYPGKFQGYKPVKEERKAAKLKEIYDNLVYDISDSDSDLKSTARSGPKDREMEDTSGSGIRINA